MSERVLVIGCGDTGRRIAVSRLAAGDEVTGLVRGADSAEGLQAAGIDALQVDLDRDFGSLPAADVVFHCAPPPPDGGDDPRLIRVLAGLTRAPRRLVYIGTSGVYGDCGGAWVSEDRPPSPQTARARRRLAAEQRLAAWGGAYAVLRAPGIYGPGRLPLDRVRAGEPVLADADSPWTNRIHVDDLAAAAVAAAAPDAPTGVFNAADGHPTKVGVYYRELAALLGVAPPPEIDWTTAEREWSAMRLSFLRESRRLDNTRLVRELGVSLRYPSYREGLADSLRGTRTA